MTTLQRVGEVAELESVTESDRYAMSSGIDYHAMEIWTGFATDEPIVYHRPVEYEGDKPVLNPSAMIADYPYVVILYGQWTVARKDPSGEISFFGLPE